ncbi:MAG: hypothetical protein ABIS03_09275 [Gemmatimonadaceae bacterium]
MKMITAIAAALCSSAVVTQAQTSARPTVATVDTALLSGMHYRMIGPARGGRVTTVTGVPQQPMTFYMGSTGGGVWKTENAGISWNNVSDGFFAAASMGSVDVSDSNPDIVYAGTGSDGIRSNVSIGKGIYKSADAGRTWKFAGLRDVGQIGAVIVHPSNPDVVFAAAIGNPFKPNSERGVYRSRNAGQTWDKVLFISDSTGAVDLEFQPGNPSVVYAAMWRAEREPWTIISGAREGGIYRSADGGTTWTKLTNGLPTGLVGKADFAVSAAKPERVYVLIEASPGGGLYRSDNAGRSFVPVDTTTRGLITRPFYYTNIDADPTNADIVYVGTESFYKSIDGGKTWATLSTPHGDNHDLWINPLNHSIMIQANDGGANVSLDGGRSWSSQYNQPTAEIYQIYVDNQFPYRVYGAQQDNTTLIVPSLPVAASPVDDPVQGWMTGPGCETGPIMPNTARPDTVYGSCKGLFSRLSLRTGQEKDYRVGAQSIYGMPGDELLYRFQRVSPLETSPHDSRTIYYGSQYVHRTRDEGVTWEKISPDLTWNPPNRRAVSGQPITIDVTGEEFYSTLYSIRESPVKAGVIWTGANDGPFYVTRDAGKSWKKVTPASQPEGCRVQNIEPSPHRAGSAYYAVLCYLLGDFRPFIWHTDNYGESWRLLTSGTNGIPADEPTRVVREDPVRAGLLYAGTEFGIYASLDNGGRWFPLQLNLPVTPVTDMKVHRGDLAISTQGRAFWILDDLSPLRQMSDSVSSGRAWLFNPGEAWRLRYSSRFGGAEANRLASGDPQYPPPGPSINYWLPAGSGVVQIEISNAAGDVIRTLSSEAPKPDSSRVTSPALAAPTLTKVAGLNRIVWDMQYAGPWDPNPRRSGRGGPLAPAGSYRVKLTANGVTQTRQLALKADPRIVADGVTAAVMREQVAFNLRTRDLLTDANRAAAELAELKKAAVSPDARRRLDAMEKILVTPSIRYSRPGLQSQIQYLYGTAIGADQQPGRDGIERYTELRRQLDAVLKDVAALRVAVR